jgi:hypothetical protein
MVLGWENDGSSYHTHPDSQYRIVPGMSSSPKNKKNSNIAFEIDGARDAEGHAIRSYYRVRTASEGSQEGMNGGGLTNFNDSTHSLYSAGSNHGMDGSLAIEGKTLVSKASIHHPQKRGSNGSNTSSFSGANHEALNHFLLKSEEQNGAVSSSFGKHGKSPSHAHALGQGQRQRQRQRGTSLGEGEGEEEEFRYVLANGATGPFSDEDDGHDATVPQEPFNPSESTASLAALKASKGLKLKSVSYFNSTNANDLYHSNMATTSAATRGKSGKRNGKSKNSFKTSLIPPFSTSHLLRFQKEQENPFLIVSNAVAYESPSIHDEEGASASSGMIIDGPLVSASISDFPKLFSSQDKSHEGDSRNGSSHYYDNSETSSLSDRALHRKNRSPGRNPHFASSSAENDPLHPQVINALKHSKELQQKRTVIPISENYTNDHLMNHLESFLAVSREEKAKKPTLNPLKKRYSVLIPSREEVKYKSTESLDKLKQQQMEKEDEVFNNLERDHQSKSLSTTSRSSSTRRRQQRLGTASSSLVLPSTSGSLSSFNKQRNSRSRIPSSATTTASLTNFIDFKPASLQPRDEKNFYQYFNNPLVSSSLSSSSQGKKRKSTLPPKVDNIVYDRSLILSRKTARSKEASPAASITETEEVKEVPSKMTDSVYTAEEANNIIQFQPPAPLELQLSVLEEGKFTSIDNSLELKSGSANDSSSLLLEHSLSSEVGVPLTILQQVGKSYSTLKLPSIHSPSIALPLPSSSLMVTALPDSSYSPPHETIYPSIHEEYYHNTPLNFDPHFLDSMRRQQYEYSYQLSDIKTMIHSHKKKAFGKLQFPSRSPIQSATTGKDNARTFLTIVGSDSHVPSSLLATETETFEENPLLATAATITQPETSITETVNTQLLPFQFDSPSSSCFSPLNANHLSTQQHTFPQREPPVTGQPQKNSTVSTPFPSLLNPSSLVFPGTHRKPLPWLVSSSLAQSASLPTPSTVVPVSSSSSIQEYLQNETIQKDNLFNRSDRIAIWKEKIELLKLTHAIDPIKHKTTIRKQNRNRTAFEQYVKQLSN